MNPFDIKTWTLKSIGNHPGKITSGTLSNKQDEKKKKYPSFKKVAGNSTTFL